MLKNYFLIALRNMQRSKLYTLINTFGLSIGIACCLLLALYIQEEFQMDKHHTRLDDLYRIVTRIRNDMATCSPPIAMTVAAEVPEVEVAARVLNPPGVSQNLIRYEDNSSTRATACWPTLRCSTFSAIHFLKATLRRRWLSPTASC
ncbi:MAG: ABC transporter permease [Bacteroidia bacterium]|nr:ABC transporter permease [Bacteroidia bacterium]